jgi:hypothetical protein
MNTVADLTESKIVVTQELNSTNASAPEGNRIDEYREREERKRMASYVQIQAREIEALRVELFMLKRKDTASLSMPPIPQSFLSQSYNGTTQTAASGGKTSQSQSFEKLPPVPGASR